MRYFIVSYKGGLLNKNKFSGDMCFECKIYPPKREIYNSIQSSLNNQSLGVFEAVTIINIIELSEQDYISYNS
jgi:hypothetical protein